MTNTVTPKVAIAETTLWFNRSGSKASSTRIEFSIEQSDSVSASYPAGGTIVRDRDNLELFSDAEATKPLVFSENQARLTNAELLAGFTAYVVGTAPSRDFGVKTTLSLVLDLLETSERKETTNFFSGTKVNRINVVVGSPGASAEIEVKEAALVTPSITIGSLDDPDTRVYSSGASTQVIFQIQEQDNEASGSFDGDGELSFSPSDAKLQLFEDLAKTEPVTMRDGKATIPNASLRAPKSFFMAVEDDAPEMPATLKLALAPGSEPAEIVTAPAVTTAIEVAKINVVTPHMVLSLDSSLDDALWFPTLAEVELPSIALQLTQTLVDEDPYTGNGQLTRSSAAIELYRDEELTSRVAFFGNDAVIDNAELSGEQPLRLFMVGSAEAEARLAFSLYDPKRRSMAVGEAVKLAIDVKPVNRVEPRIEYQGPVVPEGLTKVKILVIQTQAEGAPFEQRGTIARSDVGLEVFAGRGEGRGSDPLFRSEDKTATIENRDLIDAEKVYYATWTGTNPPATVASLELALTSSPRPFVVTRASTQLRAPAELPTWPVPLEGSNIVAPKIETEYDLVLKAGPGSTELTRTSPVRARFFVTQSNPLLPYEGDGLLVRDSSSVGVFLDPDCTVALSFSGNGEAVVPNAWLVDQQRVYYLQGVKAGALTLTLSAASPDQGFPAPPATSVGPSVDKTLAVVELKLEVYVDDASQSPAVSEVMSALAQHQGGRFVPVQNPPEHQFGRAKVVLAKVETGDWPASADQHRVLLSVVSSHDRLELFSTETSTDVVASEGHPLMISKGDAGSAATTLWAQGKAASAELSDIRIDAGIDRSDGVGWDDPEPLSNGDWALFTAVKITRVAPDGDWKQYVNQPPDRSLAVNDNDAKLETGRGILVTATVEPARAGIGVDFMLWGKDGNGDASVDAPRVPQIPQSLRAPSGHQTGVTNDSGQASARVELSRFGGDVFRAVAFLADDAIKGIAELGDKGNDAPDSNRSGPIEVWRKLAYTLAVMKRWNNGNYGTRANEATYTAKFSDSFLDLEREGAMQVLDHETVMNANDVRAWWGTNNLPDPAERTFNVVLVDSISFAAAVPEVMQIDAPSSTDVAQRVTGAYALGTKNDYLESGTGVIERTSNDSHVADIDDDRISLSFFGPADYRLRIDIAGLLSAGLQPSDVRVKVTLKRQSIVSGFSFGPQTFVALRTREQRASVTYDPTESANHTMWHETGHYLGLTAMKVPDDMQTLDVYWYMGAKSPNRTLYNQPKAVPPPDVEAELDAGVKIGQGSHCRYNERVYQQNSLATNGYIAPGITPMCIMFHALSTPITVDYCVVCEKALRARDLSSPKVSGVDDF